MWRRYGDAIYTLVTFAIFGFETLALGALSVSFLLGRTTGIASTPVEGVLLATLTSTASALALLGFFLLGYHFTSTLRDRWHVEQLDAWTERWIGLALEDTPAEQIADGSMPRRLPRAAVDAVLSLLEVVKGEEGDRLKAVLARHGVDRLLLRHLRSGHLTARLDAIESLGKARLPQAFDALLGLLEHPKPVVRRMAVRAAASTLAAMTPEPGPEGPGGRFTAALKGASLKSGVAQESLLLLETRAGAVLRDLLAEPDLGDRLRWVALETTGRLGLADMAGEVAASTTHPDPELRAAAFRALHRLGSVPRTRTRRCWTRCGTRSTSSGSRPATPRPSSRPRWPSPRSNPGWGTTPGGSGGRRPPPWRASVTTAWRPSGGRRRPIPTRPPVRWPYRFFSKRVRWTQPPPAWSRGWPEPCGARR